MQEGFKEHWRRMADKIPQGVDLGDFGFNDPVGITDWADAYYLSSFNPGHLPRSGGIRGQTSADRQDLGMYLKGITWAEFQADESRRLDDATKDNVDYTV